MKRSSLGIGRLRTQAFSFMQMQEKEVLTLGTLQSILQISAKQEKELLANLARKNYIIRLKRGVYLFPKKIPPGGKWQPSTYYLISYLMEVVHARYYISGTSAMHYHGLTEQVPNMLTVYNDKISGQRKLGKIAVQFIKVTKQKIGLSLIINVNNDRTVLMASLAQTIVDAFVNWKRFNSFPKVYDWITTFLKDKKFLRELVSTTVKYGNISAKRRIGYFLYKMTNDKQLVKPILSTINPSSSWISLVPQYGNKGKTDKTWRIIDNVKTTKK